MKTELKKQMQQSNYVVDTQRNEHRFKLDLHQFEKQQLLKQVGPGYYEPKQYFAKSYPDVIHQYFGSTSTRLGIPILNSFKPGPGSYELQS